MSNSEWPSFTDIIQSDGSGVNVAQLAKDYISRSGGDALTEAQLAIFRATLEATIWSYPLNETHRYYRLDSISQAEPNALFKPDFTASWLNKSSAPAPNASLLYMTSWLDLSEQDQVLQLPANPDDRYYVLAVLDSYINTVGSLGPRTETGSDARHVLLAGPDSPYYKDQRKQVAIETAQGPKSVEILRVDTDKAWITARINADSLSSESLGLASDFINGSRDQPGSGFQLTPLDTYKALGRVPYRRPNSQAKTGPAVDAAREAYGQVPKSAVRYFEQVNDALALNPIPSESDPDWNPPDYQIWIGNQNSEQDDTSKPYSPPSALTDAQQTRLNEAFAPIGLNLTTGFSLPADWTAAQRAAFEAYYTYATKLLFNATAKTATGDARIHNGWHISNNNIGVYPNDWSSWLVRAGVAVDGGAANIPNDAVYPTTQVDSDNNTLSSRYRYSITLPPLGGSTATEAFGPAEGFWAYTMYQPNLASDFQPFLIQNAIANTAYSPISSSGEVLSDGWLRTKRPNNWNDGAAEGTALITGSEVTLEGLKPNTTYYVSEARDPQSASDLEIQLSASYTAKVAKSTGIPIGGEGSPGASIDLSSSAGSSLDFGWINPVAQLGSSQLEGVSSNQPTLAVEDSGDLVLTIAKLDPGSTNANWLPSPSVQGLKTSDPEAASEFLMMARYYWPTTVDGQTILAKKRSSELYTPPAMQRLGLERLRTWDKLSDATKTTINNADPLLLTEDPLNTTSPYSADSSGALLDLRFLPDSLQGERMDISHSYERQADQDHQLHFYAIDDITGSIDGLAPNDPDYVSKAWSQRVHPYQPIGTQQESPSTGSGSDPFKPGIGSDQSESQKAGKHGVIHFEAGKIYAPIVRDDQGEFFTAFDSAKPGQSRHFELLNPYQFAFNQASFTDDADGIFTLKQVALA